MEFDPNDMTVKTLFKTYSKFKIPDFQRDYVWDKDSYSTFIEDIIGKILLVDNKLKASSYFLGTMVLSGDSTEDFIDVVDGQQRLTVITIIMSVISSKLQSIGEDDLAQATFKYVQEKNDNAENIKRLYSPTSFPFLETFIQSLDKKHASQPVSDEEDKLQATYNFFDGYLTDEKGKNFFGSSTDFKDFLLAVRDQILNSLVIAISTKDKGVAYMIFEILNAKGKSLASLDLIKNKLFEQFHQSDNSYDAHATFLWSEIKKTLRERDQNVGFATFYRQFWISKYKKVTSNALYDDFKSTINTTKLSASEDCLNFIETLHEEAKEYIKIVHPILSEDFSNRQEYQPVVQSLYALNNTFNIRQVRVALLSLLYVHKHNLISTLAFKKAINFIEDFVFSYTAIAKKPANMYESRFSNLAIALRKSKGKDDTNTILQSKLYDGFQDKKITFKEFEDSFITLTFKKGSATSNVLTKYVVKKLNAFFDKREVFIEQNSIEHIIHENVDDPITYNIGNLIGLEEQLNNEADNLDFLEKLEIYENSKRDQVQLFLNEYDNFTSDDISERAKKLADIYYHKILKYG